jgi:hypothetical protein
LPALDGRLIAHHAAALVTRMAASPPYTLLSGLS